MKINAQTRFPHPVLSEYSNDYLSGLFSIDVEIVERRSSGNVSIKYKVTLESDGINDLIKANLAKPVLYVICRRTYYNKIHELDLDGGQIDFTSGELFNSVTLRPVICASDKIESYSSEGVHEEYGNIQWNFEPADILAIGQEFVIDVGLDKLAPMETIFNIVTNDEVPDGETRLVLDEEKIGIAANKKTRKGIEGLRSDSVGKNVLLNGVYLPVVMQILSAIREDSSSFTDKRWFGVFSAKCVHENIDLDNPDIFVDAQKLLKAPLNRLINSKELYHNEHR